jgi:Holliday junction DNA helicase RuvA
MIAGLRGPIEGKTLDSIFVNCQGVIFQVGTSARTLGETGAVGETVSLHTRLIVREDQMSLYGFATTDELHLFDLLISVSGIGPRLACAVLSRFRVEQLHQVILSENAALLATVPGIGKKTAARLILELKGKLPQLAVSETGLATEPATAHDDEVIEALRSLGYTSGEIQSALTRIKPDGEMTTEERLLAALRILGE